MSLFLCIMTPWKDPNIGPRHHHIELLKGAGHVLLQLLEVYNGFKPDATGIPSRHHHAAAKQSIMCSLPLTMMSSPNLIRVSKLLPTWFLLGDESVAGKDEQQFYSRLGTEPRNGSHVLIDVVTNMVALIISHLHSHDFHKKVHFIIILHSLHLFHGS